MTRTTRALCLAVLATVATALFAYAPPRGGEGLYEYYSPLFLGGGPSVSSMDAPSSDALNPASQAVLQRLTLDMSYIALLGLGAETGWGSAANLSASIPKPIGVWGAGLRLVNVPASLVSMPLGTVFSARGTFAKDLWNNFWMGAGLTASVGQRGSMDWSLGLDLGFLHFPGDLSIFRNFRWGAVLAGLGKWYSPSASATFSSELDTAFPSPFTLKAGAGWDFLKTPLARISMSADMSFPIFQNVIFDTGLAFSFKESLTARVGWGANLRELASGAATPFSLIPSFGIDVAFPITTSKAADSFLSKQGWDRSELRPSLAAAPLYNGIWGIGMGAVLPLGVVDRKAPRIQAAYPESPHPEYYLSPNADGKNDEFILPIEIKDERYVASYELSVNDADGKTVRRIKNKESRPENLGLKGLFDRLSYAKKGVEVPKELRWDGRADDGQTVKDGAYSVVLSSTDDNGNSGSSEVMRLVVDATPPEGALKAPADSQALTFSPDQDGNKDTLKIQASGSKEDLWKVQVLDAAGSAVKTFEVKGASLADLSWDGKNDSGLIVPDGVYRVSAASEDRGRNALSLSMENIVVDTRQPPVSISIDSGYFSPNGDGSRDVIVFSPGVPVRSGLASWRIDVANRSGAVVYSFTGGSEGPKAEYAFNGKDSNGKALEEGSYQASIFASYVNGHAPSISSPAFILDLAPPKASAKADLAVFSPNGDGRLDEVAFALTASQEDLWTAEIKDSAGKVVNSAKYPGKVEARFVWDGTDASGARVPDGTYSFALSSVDRAGNSGASAPVPVRVDTEKKDVMLSSDVKNFSPNGDGQREAVSLNASVQDQGRVVEWRLKVKAESGADVRAWTGKGRVPEKTSWNGKSDSGSLAQDGVYGAEIWVRYDNGTEVVSQVQGITADTVFPTLALKADPLLFSPNGDGRKDAVSISHGDASADPWVGQIRDATGKALREYSFPQGPQDLSWDGTDAAGNKVGDGAYSYVISATDKAGNKTERRLDGITLDTRETGAFVTASRSGFSPNGDGKYDDISFGLIVKLKDGVASWSLSVRDKDGKALKSWLGKDGTSIPAQLPWDGKGDDGKLLNGSLTGVLAISYLKGDEIEARTGAIALDTEAPKLKLGAAPQPFSPDNDGVDDEVNISIGVQDDSDLRDWRLEIFEVAADAGKDAKPRVFMRYEGQGQPAARVTWDGKSMKGEQVEAATDYPWTFSATDSLGNVATSSGLISVDVLVIRDGNRLKIAVPSIVFRPDFADFEKLDQTVVDRNFKVVKRIAEILNKYRSYRVLIEGHANSIGKIYDYSAAKIKEEEEGDVIPLSKARADAIKKFLVQNGVEEKRLTTAGLGSSHPVVDFKDADNRWKNRRVEFILEK